MSANVFVKENKYWVSVTFVTDEEIKDVLLNFVTMEMECTQALVSAGNVHQFSMTFTEDDINAAFGENTKLNATLVVNGSQIGEQFVVRP